MPLEVHEESDGADAAAYTTPIAQGRADKRTHGHVLLGQRLCPFAFSSHCLKFLLIA